jgi:hypothetical protein
MRMKQVRVIVLRVEVMIYRDANPEHVRLKVDELLHREREDWLAAEVMFHGSAPRNEPPRPCKQCGAPVIARRSDAQYCSTACRMKSFRKANPLPNGCSRVAGAAA